MKKVIVSGAHGQLATDLLEVLNNTENQQFFDVIAYGRERLDVTHKDNLRSKFEEEKPDFFVQLTSYHVVEDINNNPKEAADVNIASLHYLSELCNEFNCTLLNFSTNYVFSGNKQQRAGDVALYEETDDPHPVNLYGILKYAGEQVVSSSCEKYFNIRVSGLFGKTGSRAKNNMNFPYIMKNKIDELDSKRGRVEVVSDQVVNVSYTVDLAEVIVQMMYKENSNNYGLYHLVNKGECTWYEVAQECAKVLGHNKKIITAIATEDFYTNLKRPKSTPLSVDKIEKTFDVRIPPWRTAIERFFVNEVM